LGVSGGDYPSVYTLFRNIAIDAGLDECFSRRVVVNSEDPKVQKVIYEAQTRVYEHIASTLPKHMQPIQAVTKHFTAPESVMSWRSRSTTLALHRSGPRG
jgi:hypothetical protein